MKHLQFFSPVPSFYQAVAKAWYLLGSGNTKMPINIRDARKQFIWGNHFITLNDKPIFNNTLSSAGIRYLNDLLDHQNLLSEKIMR